MLAIQQLKNSRLTCDKSISSWANVPNSTMRIPIANMATVIFKEPRVFRIANGAEVVLLAWLRDAEFDTVPVATFITFEITTEAILKTSQTHPAGCELTRHRP